MAKTTKKKKKSKTTKAKKPVIYTCSSCGKVTKTKLKPVIDSAAKLENIKDATGRMETGEQFGKIVIEVCK